MLFFTHKKSDCTGCSACMSACPAHCIVMKTDEEGFLYPEASDKCIKCGKCEHVCPQKKHDRTANHYNQRAIACLSRNKEIWRRSASGGAFTEICLAWGNEDTIVVGSAWNGFQAHHICINGVNNIAPLCKSKYIASDPEDTFTSISFALNQNKKVIFCGTPCLVAGLKFFLGKKFDNLLTIDLICHGVGSPSVFMNSIKIMEKKYKMAISHYEFRAKRNRYESDYIASICDSKSVKYIKGDPYINLFLEQTCLRPSCGGNCVYRDLNRQGDLTIADFKGLSQIYTDLSDSPQNYSTVVSNSLKGDYIVSLLKESMIVRECSLDLVIKYNPLFSHHTWSSTNRDSFFNDFVVNPQKAILKWQPHESIKAKVFHLLPSFVKRNILRFTKK